MSQLTSASAQKLLRENYLVWLPGWISCTTILLVYISGRNPSTNHGPWKVNIQVLQEPISDRFRLLCPRVFFPDAIILEKRRPWGRGCSSPLSHPRNKKERTLETKARLACASARYLHDPFINSFRSDEFSHFSSILYPEKLQATFS